MAVEETYDQVETGGDPDPLGLRKQLKQKQSAPSGNNDPLGLRAKMTVSKIKQNQPANTPVFQPASDWLAIPQGYTPIDANNVVNEHTQKVAESNARVKGHLNDIDKSVHNLIYEHKKDLTGRIKSQQLGINPREAGPINPQAALIESQLREDVPVAPQEVEEFKAAMNENPVMLRQGLAQKAKDLTKTDKAAANQLKADIYRLDRQANPEKDAKVSKNIEKINEGEYDYDVVQGRLLKPEGFVGSLTTGLKEKNQAFKDYDVYKTGDEKQILDLINKRVNEDPDDATPVPKGEWVTKALNEGARMVGGQPLKPIIGGAVAGYLAGPEAGAVASAAISSPEMYKLTFGSLLPQNYAALKKDNPNLTDSEVLQKAIDLTNDQANVDAATGAAMGGLAMKFGFKPTGLNSGLLQKSLGKALQQVGEAGAKKTLEGLGVGSIGAAGQLVKNLMSQKAGIKMDESEGLAQQLVGGVGMTVGMTILAKSSQLLKPKTYNQLLQSFKGVPKETIEANLNQLQEIGEITPEQAQQTQKSIQDHAVIDNSIKASVPEADRLQVQELIKKRNDLEGSLEGTDKAYHGDIKEEIKSLNEKILAVSKGAERGELQKLVDQQNKAGNVDGFVTDVLVNASENDLKKYFKEIADQAHDPNSEATTVATFGEDIVNKAKELYPKPVVEKPQSKYKGYFDEPENDGSEQTGMVQDKRMREAATGFIGEVRREGSSSYNSAKEIGDKVGATIKWDKEGSGTLSSVSDKSNKILLARNYEYKGKPLSEEIKAEIKKAADNGAEFILGDMTDVDTQLINYLDEIGADFTIYKTKGNEPIKGFTDDESFRLSNEAPRKSVSVIQPGEINRPETVTIKPTDNLAVVSEGGEPPISTPVEGSGVYVERPETQLSFRGLQETANEFGFEDVKSRDPKTDLQTRTNAERTTNEWASKGEYQKKVDEMLAKIENKEMVPTDEQRLILEQYLANEKQKGREIPKSSPEYDKQLAKIKRIKDAGQIARSEAGAALRLPDGGSGPHPIVDETDAMVAKMEANAVDKLTDQQKAEVEAQVNKYKEASDVANARVAELEEQVAKLDAEKEFKKVKSTTKKVKKTAEERALFRKEQIEAAREALKKLRSGESGLSAVPLPGVRELIAIAPHVKNIMVDLVAQGVDNLQDVVKSIHADLKDVLDGLTEKNIHDIIAGEFNEKRGPLSELTRQVRDLQDEAKLINQLEALENGVEPKTEKAKRERNQKIKDLRDKIKSLKKEDGAEQLRAIKKRNEEQAKKIRDKIAKGDFENESKTSIFDREDVKKRHPDLRDEALDAIAKKEEAQHEFDLALYEDEMAKRSKLQKAGDFAAKLVHTSKALMAGIDDSATFVQNGLAMLANPKMGAKVWLEHWKDAFNDARFKRELAAIHSRPDWEVIQKSGLDVVEPHSAASKKVEEAFEQNLLAGKIKIGGKDYEPWKHTGGIFERAFTSMGNNMRLSLFEKQMNALKEAGKTFESHPEEYKAAARAINELTGRGKLPAPLAQASPYITPFIWAPRMLASTINTLGLSDLALFPWKKGYYQNLTPAQRKFALGQLGRGVAMGASVMAAAALGGAKVDYDPRSVTFGDVIAGNHHYNVFGRYVPVVKALVQFTKGERVKPGGVQDLDSGKRGAKTRMGVVGGFFRGKMTPFAGAMYDLSEGKNYFTNKPFGVKDLPAALLTPMSVKELNEGWKNDGTLTILNRFLPAFEGLKTSDERDFAKGATSTASSSSKKGKSKPKRANPHKKS